MGSMSDEAMSNAGAQPRRSVDIFTDGACSGNPGPGGWGAVLRYIGRQPASPDLIRGSTSGAVEKELSGGETATTNNRMELMAAIAALEALNQACRVKLYTDS